MSEFFFLFKDSLITESITLWNGSEDYCPLHFLSDGRRLVQMTGSGRGSRKAGVTGSLDNLFLEEPSSLQCRNNRVLHHEHCHVTEK